MALDSAVKHSEMTDAPEKRIQGAGNSLSNLRDFCCGKILSEVFSLAISKAYLWNTKSLSTEWLNIV